MYLRAFSSISVWYFGYCFRYYPRQVLGIFGARAVMETYISGFFKTGCELAHLSNTEYCVLLLLLSLQSCLTLCDPIDGSPPGAIAFSDCVLLPEFFFIFQVSCVLAFLKCSYLMLMLLLHGLHFTNPW